MPARHSALPSVRGWARTATVALTGLALGLTSAPLSPLAVQAAAAAPAAAPDSVTSVTWTPCRNGFECANVPVPLDYDRPDGPKIEIAVIRLRAAVPRQRIGSVFVNPGGPGGSGVDMLRDFAPVVPLQIRARFDLVGFDPRGVLRSTPLRCFRSFGEAIDTLPGFAFPVTARQEREQQAADRALAAACARRGGPILNHMSTADVARDMDYLRRVQGDSTLNYVGYSYGSFLGQTYANLFPHRVRALVIDGVLDPVAWTTGGAEGRTLPFATRLRSDVGAQRTLAEFFRLCDAAGQECAFSGHADRRFAALAQRLRQHPVEIEPGFELGYADLVATTLGVLYAPAFWPLLADFLAQLEAHLETQLEAQTSPTALRRAFSALRSRLDGRSARQQEEYPNFVEAFPGVACSDSVNPTSFAAWRQAADTAEQKHGYFGRPWTWASSICLPWPSSAGQDRYLGPWTARTASPVLVVGNYFDPATRYQGAVAAARLLPNSGLLSYAGWGHTAFLTQGNYCVDRHVTSYLLSTRLPKAGTVCRPTGSPFGPDEAAARARVSITDTLPVAVRRALANR